jgi:hypothetical protein
MGIFSSMGLKAQSIKPRVSSVMVVHAMAGTIGITKIRMASFNP